ncbi:hypothetical protein M9H77_36977 [Catharanthus roseus]|uniref:Uncharacterized protein n=1 Tax=Catharanthus roseus TaxID=4058 RepID=A0ACB9ZXL4_CATRO|nr:hypothetical protein M9H77_36977 [Catharanthus roseus]
MEKAKGKVKHVVLVKFKDEASGEQIEQIIKDYTSLVNLIEPIKSLEWGKDLRMTNLNQGFTHVFESIFENVEGVAEYGTHPAHLELKDRFLALLDKILVLDYELATLNP